MQSIIYRYLNEYNELMMWFWSYQYMKVQLQTAKQLIDYIGIEQTEEEYYNTVNASQEELYYMLTNFINNNELYLFLPN